MFEIYAYTDISLDYKNHHCTLLFVQSFSKTFDIMKINVLRFEEKILEVTSIFLFIIINIQVTTYDGVTTSINVSIKYFKV